MMNMMISAAVVASGATSTHAQQNVDPVYALIESHRAAECAYKDLYASLKDKLHERATDDILEPYQEAEVTALADLVEEAAPATLDGLKAWVYYLAELMEADPYAFDEQHFAAFLPNLSEALTSLVSS